MATVFLTYKLKPETAREDYEAWIRATDYPAMRGLRRVALQQEGSGRRR